MSHAIIPKLVQASAGILSIKLISHFPSCPVTIKTVLVSMQVLKSELQMRSRWASKCWQFGQVKNRMCFTWAFKLVSKKLICPIPGGATLLSLGKLHICSSRRNNRIKWEIHRIVGILAQNCWQYPFCIPIRRMVSLYLYRLASVGLWHRG